MRIVNLAVFAVLASGLTACSEESLVDPSVPIVIQGVKVASITPFKLVVQLEGAPRAIEEGTVMVKVSVTGKTVPEGERPVAGDVVLTRGSQVLPLAEAVTSFTHAFKERLPPTCQLPGEDDWVCTGKGVLDVLIEVTSYNGKDLESLAGPTRFDVEVK